MTFPMAGPIRLIMFDIHALQERFYFGDNIIPILESATHLILAKIEEVHKDEHV